MTPDDENNGIMGLQKNNCNVITVSCCINILIYPNENANLKSPRFSVRASQLGGNTHTALQRQTLKSGNDIKHRRDLGILLLLDMHQKNTMK